MYLIFLQGDTANLQSYVKDLRDDRTVATHGGAILDCDQFKDFWIRWEAGDFWVMIHFCFTSI